MVECLACFLDRIKQQPCRLGKAADDPGADAVMGREQRTGIIAGAGIVDATRRAYKQLTCHSRAHNGPFLQTEIDLPIEPVNIAIVLPRGMHFGPDRATAIDLCVRDFVAHSRYRSTTTVIGEALTDPFADIAFQGVSRDPGENQKRFVRKLADRAKDCRPDLVVVHQHLSSAVTIREVFPDLPVLLHKHNTPKIGSGFIKKLLDRRRYGAFDHLIFVSDFSREKFLGSLPVLIVRLFLGLKPLRIGFALLLAVSLAAVAYGWDNARRVEVREVVLKTAKLPPGLKELKIAVIADLHLNSVELEGRLHRVVKTLEGLDYDLLLSLGDLIEVGLDWQNWKPLAAELAALKPRLGKYAVMGNHEFYTGRYGDPDFAARFHRRAGFTLLRQEAEVVAGTVQLVGIDDRHFGLPPGKARSIELNLLQQLCPKLPTLLLKHRPEVSQTSLGLFDLQLSGHTHAGQMWPFNYAVALVFGRTRGLHELSSSSRLYITQGTGTWGPPVRVGTQAELTLLRLVKAE